MKKEDILHTFYRGPEEGVDRFENRRCQAGLLQSFHRVVTQRVEHVAPVVHKQLARAGGRAGARCDQKGVGGRRSGGDGTTGDKEKGTN